MDMRTAEEILPENVVIKMSCCGKCNGILRAAVKHCMGIKSKNSFMKEVMEHNLSVKEMPLLEYNSTQPKWCDCE